MSTQQSNHMKYDILGADFLSQDEKISKYTGDVDWAYLLPHFNRNALIYVDPELDLNEVAKAFTDDDKTKVAQWMKKADILQPGPEHAEWWNHDKTRFTAVICNPFVLAQPIRK